MTTKPADVDRGASPSDGVDEEPPDPCGLTMLPPPLRNGLVRRLTVLYAEREAHRLDLREAVDDDDHVRVALMATLYLRAVHHYQGVISLLDAVGFTSEAIEAIEHEAALLAEGEIIERRRHRSWDPRYEADVYQLENSIFHD